MGGSQSSCLTCELDKAFLEYYGSAVGIDALDALSETGSSVSSLAGTTVNSIEFGSTCGKKSGHPIISTYLLAEVWKNVGMKHLAGQNQHDAQEFFHAFLDCLASHEKSYQKLVLKTKQSLYQAQIQRPSENDHRKSSGDGT